jgi:hypothetical protein
VTCVSLHAVNKEDFYIGSVKRDSDGVGAVRHTIIDLCAVCASEVGNVCCRHEKIMSVKEVVCAYVEFYSHPNQQRTPRFACQFQFDPFTILEHVCPTDNSAMSPGIHVLHKLVCSPHSISL